MTLEAAGDVVGVVVFATVVVVVIVGVSSADTLGTSDANTVLGKPEVVQLITSLFVQLGLLLMPVAAISGVSVVAVFNSETVGSATVVTNDTIACESAGFESKAVWFVEQGCFLLLASVLWTLDVADLGLLLVLLPRMSSPREPPLEDSRLFFPEEDVDVASSLRCLTLQLLLLLLAPLHINKSLLSSCSKFS